MQFVNRGPGFAGRQDQHGQDLIAALQAERVRTDAVRRDERAWPGVAVIMVASEGGENAIVVVPGSNADLDTGDVEQGGAPIE